MSNYVPITEEDRWFAGEKKVFEFTVVDANDDVVDITGWEIEWVFRQHVAEETMLIYKTNAAGLVITDGPGGVVQITIDPEDTVELPAINGAHAAKRSDGDNDAVLLHGEAMLQQAATR